MLQFLAKSFASIWKDSSRLLNNSCKNLTKILLVSWIILARSCKNFARILHGAWMIITHCCHNFHLCRETLNNKALASRSLDRLSSKGCSASSTMYSSVLKFWWIYCSISMDMEHTVKSRCFSRFRRSSVECVLKITMVTKYIYRAMPKIFRVSGDFAKNLRPVGWGKNFLLEKILVFRVLY